MEIVTTTYRIAPSREKGVFVIHCGEHRNIFFTDSSLSNCFSCRATLAYCNSFLSVPTSSVHPGSCPGRCGNRCISRTVISTVWCENPGSLRTGAPAAGAKGRIRRSGSCYGAATAGSGCCCSLWGWGPTCLPPTACPNTGCCSRAARWASKEQENKWRGGNHIQLNRLKYKDEPSQTHLSDSPQLIETHPIAAPREQIW